MKESAISFIRGENAFPPQESLKISHDDSRYDKFLENKESYYAYQEMFSALIPADLKDESSSKPFSRARKIYRKEL